MSHAVTLVALLVTVFAVAGQQTNTVSTNAVADSAANALKEEQARSLLAEIDSYGEGSDEGSDIVDELIEIGPPAVPVLIAAIEPAVSNQVMYRAIFEALGAIGDPRGVAPMFSVASRTVEQVGCACVEVWWGMSLYDNAVMEQEMRHIAADAHSPLRTHALAYLEDCVPSQMIDHVMESARSTNQWIRERAARHLDEMGDPRAFGVIMSILEDTNAIFTAGDWPLRVLGKPGNKRAIPALTAVMKDRTRRSWIRGDVARAIGNIGDRSATGTLLAELNDTNDEVRVGVVHALGILGDPKVWGALTNVFLSSSGDLQDTAAIALWKIGKERAAPYLKVAIDAPTDWGRSRISRVLEGVPDKWATDLLLGSLNSSCDMLRRETIESLSERLDKRVIEALVRNMSARINVAPGPILVALAQGDQTDLMDVLKRLSKDASPDVRRNVASVLGRLGGAPAIPILEQLLKDRASTVSARAGEALDWMCVSRRPDSRKKDEGPKQEGWSRTKWRNARLQENVLMSMDAGALSNEVVAAFSTSSYRGDEMPSDVVAVRALIRLGEKGGYRIMLELLGHKKRSVRTHAANALAKVRGPAAIPFLLAAQTNAFARARASAAESLGYIGDTLAVTSLRSAMSDPNQWVRLSAAGALARLGDESGYAFLFRVLEDGGRNRRREYEGCLFSVLYSLRDACTIERVLALNRKGSVYIGGDLGAGIALAPGWRGFRDQVRKVRDATDPESQERLQANGILENMRHQVYGTRCSSIEARAALLRLLRTDRAVFVGLDPVSLERADMEELGGGRFRWGPFLIDTWDKTYRVSEGSGRNATSRRGIFRTGERHICYDDAWENTWDADRPEH